MNDRNLVMGLVLIAISLAFGLQALRYPTGDLSPRVQRSHGSGPRS